MTLNAADILSAIGADREHLLLNWVGGDAGEPLDHSGSNVVGVFGHSSLFTLGLSVKHSNKKIVQPRKDRPSDQAIEESPHQSDYATHWTDRIASIHHADQRRLAGCSIKHDDPPR